MDLELVHERAYSAVGEMRGLFRPEECKRFYCETEIDRIKCSTSLRF